MCGKVLIVLALTALSVSAANGLPDLSVKSQRRTAPVSASHKAKHPANHATGRTAAHASKRTATHKTGRTPLHASGHAVRRASRHEFGRASSSKHSMGGEEHAASPRQPSRFHQVRNSHPAAETDTVSLHAMPEAVSRRKARVAMPPPLRGSYASLIRQNEKTEDDNLERIEDDADLADRIARKMLVPVPSSASLTINGNLPENYRYCRPWTARFLADLARVHEVAFHRPLEVSSAVRTVEYQKRLMESNGNAAAAEGDIASPHLTGATIDIAKQRDEPTGDGLDAEPSAAPPAGRHDRRRRGVPAGLLPHHGL